jgi:alpha-beta hydrolase superfamily lysophospholipase
MPAAGQIMSGGFRQHVLQFSAEFRFCIEGDGGDEMLSSHTTGTYESNDGLRLFEQEWCPAGTPKAGVVIVHGYGEHGCRYGHVAEELSRNGYAVSTFDLRGHGQSQGVPRTFVRSFDEHLDDLEFFFSRVRGRHPGRPLFLFGHSMGGTISTLFAMTRRPEIRGLLLSGASLKLSDKYSPSLIRLAKIISLFFPKLRLLKLDPNAVSRDPEVVRDYVSDPLVYHGGVPARTGAELNRAMERIHEGMKALEVPLLIMHGTGDLLADPEGSRQLYGRSGSGDKDLRLYEGLYHEILNEPERAEVLADMVQWLDVH